MEQQSDGLRPQSLHESHHPEVYPGRPQDSDREDQAIRGTFFAPAPENGRHAHADAIPPNMPGLSLLNESAWPLGGDDLDHMHAGAGHLPHTRLPLHDSTSSSIPAWNSLDDEALFNSSFMGQDTCYVAPSDSSVGSAESLASSVSKQIRRRRRRKQAPSSRQQPAGKRRYQCTFCTDTFRTKHDWQRHESTLHLSLEQWHCVRFGPFSMDPDGSMYCVFCGLADPTTDHIQLHSYSTCVAKPPAERIFLRKDHLLQHLRLVHNGCKFNERMESWVSTVDTVRSRCGFCDAQMTSWAEREKHLAHHFKSGTDMADWKGDRGFDPEIESIVQDDMPAFMISQQRETVEPFSASRADHCIGNMSQAATYPAQDTTDSLASPASGHNAHSYRQVEHLLLAFVSEEIGQGRVPSDSQLKKKTGDIMYGPDHDDWEQTWADNTQWMEQFRKKAGLISLPLSGGKNAFVGHDTL